jgi:NADH-quinone oxidoreductase subunit N
MAFFFKVGAVPFHFWMCDVYDGSLLSVTLLFSAVPKIIIFGLLVKFCIIVGPEFQIFWSPLFLFSGVASIAIGSISALFQKRLKRLLAYSTISHTGFILLSLISASPASTKAMVFYLVVYSLLTILVFSLIIFVTCSLTKLPNYLVNWTANGTKNITLISALSLTLLSIAGIPPLVGFFSKFFILSTVVSSGFLITSLSVVIISSVGCFYYVRLIKMFLFTKQSKNGFWVSSSRNNFLEVVISAIFFFNAFFILKPEIFSLFSLVASLSIV